MLKRLETLNKNKQPEIVKRICTNCKFRRGKRGYDQEWGYYPIIENWCAKSTDLMHTFYQHGNGKHFSEECEFFEKGSGVIESD